MPEETTSIQMPDLVPGKESTKWYKKISINLRILLALVAVGWAVEIIDLIPFFELDSFGVRPREIKGLIGIPLMPFLHGDFSHLLSNTFPFIVLGWIVLKAERKKFILVSIIIILLGGLGTWLFGREHTIHIGASGLVYGYFGYVITRAFMERNFIWITTGLLVAFFYGSLIFGALPVQDQTISWEGHLFGMLAGGWYGWIRSKKAKELAIKKEEEDPVQKILADIRKNNEKEASL